MNPERMTGFIGQLHGKVVSTFATYLDVSSEVLALDDVAKYNMMEGIKVNENDCTWDCTDLLLRIECSFEFEHLHIAIARTYRLRLKYSQVMCKH